MQLRRRHTIIPSLAVLVFLALSPESSEARDANRRPTDAERGEELYQRHCVQCHGATADGKGPAAEALVHPVPDLRGEIKIDKASEEVVLRGRNAMPGFLRSFGSSDARSVLRHMKGLGDGTIQPPSEPSAEPRRERAREALLNRGVKAPREALRTERIRLQPRARPDQTDGVPAARAADDADDPEGDETDP